MYLYILRFAAGDWTIVHTVQCAPSVEDGRVTYLGSSEPSEPCDVYPIGHFVDGELELNLDALPDDLRREYITDMEENTADLDDLRHQLRTTSCVRQQIAYTKFAGDKKSRV